MARRGSIACLLLAASLPAVTSGARAAELVLGAETALRYDSNVTRSETDEKADGAADLGPTLRLREGSGNLRYDLYYAPAYQQYFTETGLSAWRQYVRAESTYDLDERTSFTLVDRFYYAPSVVEAFIDSGGAAAPTSTVGIQKYLLNDATVGGSYLFSPRLRGSLQISNSLYEPKDNDSTSSRTWGASPQLLYALTSSDRVGGGFGFNQQRYEPPFQPTSRTRFYQVYGTWAHDVDPTWNFSISAGPTLISPDEASLEGQSIVANPLPIASDGRTYVVSTCPTSGSDVIFDGSRCKLSAPEQLSLDLQNELIARGVPQPFALLEAQSLINQASQPVELTNTASAGSSEDSLTYFASASMTKKWRNWDAILSYSRSAGSGSGYGTSNILDTLSAVGVWRPSPLWYVSLTGRWDRRETASEQSVLVATVNPAGTSFDSSIDSSDEPIVIPSVVSLNGLTTQKVNSNEALQDFAVLLYGQRRMTKHLTIFGRASFYSQKSKGDVSRSNEYNDAIVSLGIRYELAPITLPFL